eukprot:5831028-Prymnesium_polylepis.2
MSTECFGQRGWAGIVCRVFWSDSWAGTWCAVILVGRLGWSEGSGLRSAYRHCVDPDHSL